MENFNKEENFFFLFKAFSSGVYGSQYVWVWLETLRPFWWSEGNKTKDEMMKAVVRYSFGFGDNLNVLDNATTTVSGRVSITEHGSLISPHCRYFVQIP